MAVESERLREARELAGYDSAAQAARELGMEYPTYVGHENGSRGYDKDEARVYARKFKVSLWWLLYGIGQPKAKTLEAEISSLSERKQADLVKYLDFLKSQPD
jgi:hypothetical protein